MQFTDFIAAKITSSLKSQTADQPVNFFGIKTKLDLDPKGGFLLSTDKVISLRDNKGNSYKITIEAI